ncbi:MMPL family transporter [Actinoplanes sp. HUAS TT8]|uniref:MMPL family transporter n=1 Tax=Actinoplanes sp. HUAS TT8 TaxID=3447453 RepID=UPI003F51E69E
MLSRVGQFCFRRRWIVLISWLIVIVAGGLAIGPVLSSLAANRPSQGMESNSGRQVLAAEGDSYNRLYAVVDGIQGNEAQAGQAISAATADLRNVPGIASVDAPVAAADGDGFEVTVTMAKLDNDARKTTLKAATARIDRIAQEVPGSTVLIGGDQPQANETNSRSQADLLHAEVLSLPITLILLVIVFGGLVAALLPLTAAVGAITGSFLGVLLFLQVVPMDSTVMNVVMFIGLGLSIDYGLLLIARFRDELAGGHAPDVAIRRTWASAGRTIMFSGLTVMAALAGMLAFDIPRLQTMGAAGISATLIAMLAALTLPGALLGAFGRFVKPSRRAVAKLQRRENNLHTGFFFGLARFVQKRARLVTLVAVGTLFLAGLPLLGAHARLPQLDGLPQSMKTVQAARILSADYRIEVQPAVFVLARTSPQDLDAWAARLKAEPGTGVAGPAREVGTNLSTIAFRTTGHAQGPEAQALVHDIKDNRPPGGQSWVMGDAAVLLDLTEKVQEGLPWMILVMLASMLVLLFLMTGSVVAPIKAVLMNLLSIGATFGVMVAVVQFGWLSGPLDVLTLGGLSPYTFVMVFAFAFGFSMDYEIFLLSRIKEFVDAGHDTDSAVRLGLQRSGSIITSAALLMLVVFAGFATAQLADIEELGIGLFVAVAVDSTLIRCVLVPAVMTLLGRWNWWAPRPLRKLHDRFGVTEHAESPRDLATAS